jgi:hypothetical protein
MGQMQAACYEKECVEGGAAFAVFKFASRRPGLRIQGGSTRLSTAVFLSS